MFNLIRKDFLLMVSSKSTILMFLMFLPILQLALGRDNPTSIAFINIILIGYALTTMSFAFEVKNKPYITIRSLPIKTTDIVISKYLQMFINYIIAIVFTFIYIKFLNLFGFQVLGSFDITMLKLSFLLIVLSLSISLPLQFILPPKIANFVNVFIYISLMNNFSSDFYDSTFANLGDPTTVILLISAFFISMGISTLLYKNRNLS